MVNIIEILVNNAFIVSQPADMQRSQVRQKQLPTDNRGREKHLSS